MRLIDADEFKAVISTPVDGDGPVRYAARTIIEAVIRALDREPTVCCERCVHSVIRNSPPSVCRINISSFHPYGTIEKSFGCVYFKERQA